MNDMYTVQLYHSQINKQKEHGSQMSIIYTPNMTCANFISLSLETGLVIASATMSSVGQYTSVIFSSLMVDLIGIGIGLYLSLSQVQRNFKVLSSQCNI